LTPKLPFSRDWGDDYPDEFRFRDEHGQDERDNQAHHSETDEHHGSSVYRKPSGQLDAEDEAA
jgi:hypothetical protein